MESFGYPHLALAQDPASPIEVQLANAIAWERLSSQGWMRFLSLLMAATMVSAVAAPALAGGAGADYPAFVTPDRPAVNQPLPPITVRPCPTFKTISSYVYRPPYLRNSGSGRFGWGANPCYSCVGGRNVNTSRLQQRLKDLGYFHFRVTGYYGPITENAVKRFQRDHGLVPDGIAGPRTKAALGMFG